MKRISSLVIVILIATTLFGQSIINEALKQIEANNPTIRALQAYSESIKADARAELLPPNPSVEGGRFPAVQGAGMKYAWGVNQHFEFPTVYAKRNQLAKATDGFANASFIATRQEVLLSAKLTILEVIHLKNILSEYKRREEFAEKLMTIIQKKVAAGQASALELNNAKLRVAEANQNTKEVEASISIAMQRLITFNGNEDIQINDSFLVLEQLPERTELLSQFMSNDPRFLTLDQMVSVAEGQRSLVVHQGLPELSVGYESEKTDAEHFMGFRAGLTIPLWGNTGKRRASKVQLNATRLEQASQRQMLELEFSELYTKAYSIKLRIDELSKALAEFSNISLLQRALEVGQISVIDLFNEVTFLYGINDRIMELELEYAKCYAELFRFEL